MPLFKSFFGRKEPKEQDKKEPPPKAKAEEPPPPRTAPVTGGEKAPARMPPSPLEGKKKPGAKSADVGLDDIKSALEQISSVLSSDEDQAQVGQEGETVLSLSLSDLLGLLPPGYVVEGVKPPEGLEKVSVEVDDLFEQLSAGRVAVKVATLVQNFPGEMLLTNAFEDQATVVELPLHLVVAAVNPEALKKRTAQTPGRYTVDHLPNPFEKMGVAQRATAQAPVAQPAEPAEAASVAEVAAAAPEDAAVAAQSPTVADTEATLDEIVAALGVAETPAQTTAEIAAPAEAAVEEAAPAEAVIEAAALAEAAVEAAAPAEAEAPELPPGLRIPGVEAAEEAAAPAEAAVEEAAPVEAEAPELPPGLRIPGVEAAEEAAAPAEAVIEEAVPAEAEAPALPPGLEIPGVAAAEEAAAPAEAVIEEAAPAEAEAPELPPGLPIPGVETAEEAAAPAWAAVEEAAPAEAEAPALPPGLEIPGVAAAGEAVAPAEAEAPAPGLPIPPTEVPEEVPEEAAAAVVAETTPVEAEPPPVPAPPAWQAPAAPLPEEAAAPAEAAMLPTEAPTVPGVLAGVAALGAAAEAPPIPVAEEERPPEAVSAEPVAEPAREISEISERLGGVNLNTAKIEQLMTLDGVTLRIAKGIADYREKHGPFKSIWSLRSVPVIGRKTFKKITGMPYSAKGHERREKLAKMLKLPLPKMARVRNIAEAFAKQPGFTGCVICDRDGFLLAHGRSEEFADSLSAVAPQLFKKLAEYLESVDLQTVEAATFFAGDLPLTFVESGHICFVAVHQKRKVTMTQIRFAQRVVEELEWLLGRRGYIGLEE